MQEGTEEGPLPMNRCELSLRAQGKQEEATTLPCQALPSLFPPLLPPGHEQPCLPGEFRAFSQLLPPGSQTNSPVSSLTCTAAGLTSPSTCTRVGTSAGPRVNPQQVLRRWEPNCAELNPTGNESSLSLWSLGCQTPSQRLYCTMPSKCISVPQ